MPPHKRRRPSCSLQPPQTNNKISRSYPQNTHAPRYKHKSICHLKKKKKNSRTQEKRSSFFCPSHLLLLPLAALLARSNLSLSLAAVNPTTNSPVAGCSRLLRASISCGRVVARLLPNDPSPPPLPLIGVVIHHRRRSSAADVPRRRRAER